MKEKHPQDDVRGNFAWTHVPCYSPSLPGGLLIEVEVKIEMLYYGRRQWKVFNTENNMEECGAREDIVTAYEIKDRTITRQVTKQALWRSGRRFF
jgi:hypothetical protein